MYTLSVVDNNNPENSFTESHEFRLPLLIKLVEIYEDAYDWCEFLMDGDKVSVREYPVSSLSLDLELKDV